MGISVFVVDQERTFADALAARLEAEEDVEVVAAVHARTPAECLIVGRHADVMLLDGDLPERATMRLCGPWAARGRLRWTGGRHRTRCRFRSLCGSLGCGRGG